MSDDHAEAASLETRRCMFVFSRQTVTGTVEDDAIFSLHVINITAGEPDATWTAGDYTTLQAKLLAFWAELRPEISSTHTLKQIRVYEEGPAIIVSGPPVLIITVAESGSATGVVCPYQVASTVTLHTAFPKHWGRIYIPGITTGKLGSYGRLNTSHIGATVTAVKNLMTQLHASDFELVVVSKARKAIMSVSHLHADDIPDIQRRRRARQVGARYDWPAL